LFLSEYVIADIRLLFSRRGGKHDFSQSALFKDGKSLEVLKTELRFRTGKDSLEMATSGFIVSASHPELKTAATSGWQPNPRRSLNILDNAKYIRLVQEFSRLLKFKLIRSQRDNNGKPPPEHHGRFVASHTVRRREASHLDPVKVLTMQQEKKLAVFWVLAALKAVLNTTDFRRMGELREFNNPECWRTAWVFLDHTLCGNVGPPMVVHAGLV
jgi:hypothetical protein